ncbi:MAG: acyltransferase [Burkholderiales bacterium]|nr:acyltransferase [Burkholderiales bacterium]
MRTPHESGQGGEAYLPSLDGLRALAVLLVVPHNLRLMVEPHDRATHLLDAILDRGWIGVDLFFVLSGFLITRILLKTRATPLYFRNFYVRRVLRIWPLYYLALLLMLGLAPAMGWVPDHDRSYDPFFWLFLSNLVQPLQHRGPSLPHFWSLAVEEQFYLIWPWVVAWLSPKSLFRVCGGLMAFSLIFRWWALHQGWDPEVVYVRTWCRMDALAMGSLLAVWMQTPSAARWFQARPRTAWHWPAGILCAGAVASGGFRQFGLWPQSLGLLGLDLGMAAVLACVVAFDQGWVRGTDWLQHPWLRRIGRYSYGMYVWHVPLGVLLLMPGAQRMGWDVKPGAALQTLYVVGAVAATYGVASLSYRWLERPFLALKSRLAPYP